MERRRKSAKNIDMDQRKRIGFGIINVAGTHEGEEENFKEKLSNVECFQMVEENKDKNLQRVFEIFPLGAVV